ncbi:MAG: ABC transporter permease [Oscillospiraceae bacterium]|nr:ABC transporter permease [Oscillospiraceae bacterium]
MEKNTKRSSSGVWQKILRCGVISWIIIITVWGLGSLAYDEYFLPSPKETLDSLLLLIKNGTLWADIVASVGRVVKGWLLAIVFAVPSGLLIGNFKHVRWLVEPILSFFRFVPAIALTTLFLMWFGVGEESKVALIFYASFFPIFVNTIAGVATTDKSLVEAASCMGAKKARTFFTVVIPSAVANVYTGIRLGLSSSFICVIAAEMLVGSNGLGYLINSSKLYYKTSWAFAGIVTLAVIGFLADRLLQFAGKKLLKHFGVK